MATAKGTHAGKEPKAETLKRENVVLNGLVKFAVTRGYLAKADAPDVADRSFGPLRYLDRFAQPYDVFRTGQLGGWSVAPL